MDSPAEIRNNRESRNMQKLRYLKGVDYNIADSNGRAVCGRSLAGIVGSNPAESKYKVVQI